MLQVVSIGTVVQDPSCCTVLSGKPIIFPDHYTVHRAVFLSSAYPSKPAMVFKGSVAGTASSTAMETPYFTASIAVEAGAGNDATLLRFTITRSDNPTQKTYSSTKSVNAAWREALEEAARDFPDRRAELLVPYDAKGRLQVNGGRLFGLHLKEVQEELMALPGGPAAFEIAAAAAPQKGASEASPPVSQPLVSAKSTERSRTKSSSRKRAASGDPEGSSSGLQHQPDDDADSSANANGIETPSVVAVTPVKAKRQRKPKAEVTVTAVVDGAEGSAAASPPTKRRRASAKKGGDGAATPTPASATAVTVICPDCGLAGTPFCAATGKPHEIPACPTCGLRTAFCPVSGQPHAGAIQRENRQRGEVHLPGTTRKPRRKTAAAVATTGAQPHASGASSDVNEVTVVNTQESSGTLAVGEAGEVSAATGETAAKKPRRKRARTAASGVEGETGGSGGDLAAAASGASALPRTHRSRKAKKADAMEASARGAAGADARAKQNGTPTADAAPPPPAEGDVSLFAIAQETVYIYPPLRPPLSTRDHHKAAQLMQENWKAQYGDGPVLPPAVAAVPLALVPARRAAGSAVAPSATAAVAGKGRRKGRGATTVKEEEEQQHNDEDVKDAAEDTEAEALSSHAGSPTAMSAPAALPTMVHPLEVTQLSTSVAGKRLAKFLLQYASERSKLDVLRSHAASATTNTTTTATGTGSGEKKRSAKMKKRGDEQVEAVEGSEVDNHVQAQGSMEGVEVPEGMTHAEGAESPEVADEKEEEVDYNAGESAQNGKEAVEA